MECLPSFRSVLDVLTVYLLGWAAIQFILPAFIAPYTLWTHRWAYSEISWSNRRRVFRNLAEEYFDAVGDLILAAILWPLIPIVVFACIIYPIYAELREGVSALFSPKSAAK